MRMPSDASPLNPNAGEEAAKDNDNSNEAMASDASPPGNVTYGSSDDDSSTAGNADSSEAPARELVAVVTNLNVGTEFRNQMDTTGTGSASDPIIIDSLVPVLPELPKLCTTATGNGTADMDISSTVSHGPSSLSQTPSVSTDASTSTTDPPTAGKNCLEARGVKRTLSEYMNDLDREIANAINQASSAKKSAGETGKSGGPQAKTSTNPNGSYAIITPSSESELKIRIKYITDRVNALRSQSPATANRTILVPHRSTQNRQIPPVTTLPVSTSLAGAPTSSNALLHGPPSASRAALMASMMSTSTAMIQASATQPTASTSSQVASSSTTAATPSFSGAALSAQASTAKSAKIEEIKTWLSQPTTSKPTATGRPVMTILNPLPAPAHSATGRPVMTILNPLPAPAHSATHPASAYINPATSTYPLPAPLLAAMQSHFSQKYPNMRNMPFVQLQFPGGLHANPPPAHMQIPSGSASAPAGQAMMHYHFGGPSTQPWRTDGHDLPDTTTNLKALPPPTVKAATPSPPKFNEQLDETIMSLSTYKTFPVDSATQEFQIILEMMSPYQVESVEHIVNPELWQRFQNTRKEMLRVKSDDMELLAKMGFDEIQVKQRAHLAKFFVKNPLLGSASYSPNEVLLFHCTRKVENLEKIFTQGLDERLCSNSGGFCGKGIYFADDPMKSVAYDGTKGTIIVFGVLLGDCLAVHDYVKMRTFVREPEKERTQQWSSNDNFFDSITSRPRGHTEYVIYNRNQCIPFYKIQYKKLPQRCPVERTKYLTEARKTMPPIAWNPHPNPHQNGGWPFYAVSLFERMNGPFTPYPDPIGPTPTIPPPVGTITPIRNMMLSAAQGAFDRSQVEAKTKEISSILGLQEKDRLKIEAALIRFNLDMNQTINFLLDYGNRSGPTPSTSASNNQGPSTSANPGSAPSGPVASTSASNNPAPKVSITKIPVPGHSTNKGLSVKINFPKMYIKGLKNSQKDSPNDTKMAKHRELRSDRRKLHLLVAAAEQLRNEAIASSGTSQSQSPTISSSGDANGTGTASVVRDASRPTPTVTTEEEDCFICCDTFPAYSHHPQFWKKLKCDHQLCLNCHKNIETRGKTLSGTLCIGTKCPFCQDITIVGMCPLGKMTETIVNTPCEGYPNTSTIQIDYTLLSRNVHHIRRVAYLPHTRDGHEVLKLLRLAWDRRLTFEIGRSATTGQDNVPVWSIHHKTSLSGGGHGYPDSNYLDRVKQELKTFGIE